MYLPITNMTFSKKMKGFWFLLRKVIVTLKLIDGFCLYFIISIKIYLKWCTLSFNKVYQLVLKKQQLCEAGYRIVSYFAMCHVCYRPIHQWDKKSIDKKQLDISIWNFVQRFVFLLPFVQDKNKHKALSSFWAIHI